MVSLDDLSQKGDHESRVVVKVPASEAPRFLSQPEKPLESRALGPFRGAASQSREKIEQAAHPDHRDLEPVTGPGHPFVLRRGSHADPDDISFAQPDPVDDRLALFGRNRSPGCGCRSDDRDSGETLQQTCGDGLRLTGPPADEEVLPVGETSTAGEEEIVVVNSFRRTSEPAQRPDDRHSIRGQQLGPLEDPAVLRPVLGEHDRVNVRAAHVAVPPGSDHSASSRQAPSNVVTLTGAETIRTRLGGLADSSSGT